MGSSTFHSLSCFPVFAASTGPDAIGGAIANKGSHQMKAHKRTRVREGKYANYFEVGHNAFEFYIDFGQYDPKSEKVEMHTRIVTSPAYAKMMGETLSSSVESFEREHGPIPTNSDEVDAMEMVRQSLKRTET
jgi:hypothetical protein